MANVAMESRQARPPKQELGRSAAGPKQTQLSALSAALNARAAQRMPNPAGLPDALKAGVEALSGLSMDDVRVHRHSAEPAEIGALAYAQGRDIHLAPGQEKHLPHEAWHVAQQAQGRVKPTRQAKGVGINDDAELEREADVMGARALQLQPSGASDAETASRSPSTSAGLSQAVRQCVIYNSEAALWQAVEPGAQLSAIRAVINGNGELRTAYEDSLLHLNIMNFVESAGTQPVASYALNAGHTYDITYGLRATLDGHFNEQAHFIAAIIHEMGHVSAGQDYSTNIAAGETYHIANMHLPAAVGATFAGTAIGENQANDPIHGWNAQTATMATNWGVLAALRTEDHGFTENEIDHLATREEYAMGVAPAAHYDTVLLDILYFLQHAGLTQTHYYAQATAMLREANVRRRAGHGVMAVVPLAPAPPNRFLSLYNAVSALLSDANWSNEGKGVFGAKVPAGIKAMRQVLNAGGNKRQALNQIRNLAVAQNRTQSANRSRSTINAYAALAELGLRNDFEALIAEVRLCTLSLGNNQEALELQDF